MTVEQLYRRAVAVGMEVDYRGAAFLQEQMANAKAEYQGLCQAERARFDRERLTNPYGDTRIVNGPLDREVSSVLVGIEIYGAELLLAHAMGQAGKPVDLVIAHHTTPINRGLFYMDDIVDIHKSALREIGADVQRGDELVEKWKTQIGIYWRDVTPPFARLLDIPLMTIHTPADLCHRHARHEALQAHPDIAVGEYIELLNSWPEFEASPYAKVRLLCGDERAPVGKLYDPTAAGWRPLLDIFELACQADIDSAFIVSPTAEYVQMAASYGVNLIELPHDANDNVGLNLMLDALSQDEPLTVYGCSNFVRMERASKQAG